MDALMNTPVAPPARNTSTKPAINFHFSALFIGRPHLEWPNRRWRIHSLTPEWHRHSGRTRARPRRLPKRALLPPQAPPGAEAHRTRRHFRSDAKAQSRECRNQTAFRRAPRLSLWRRRAVTDQDRHFSQGPPRSNFCELCFHFLTGPKRADFNRGRAQARDLVNFFDGTALQVKQIDHEAFNWLEQLKQMFDQLA